MVLLSSSTDVAVEPQDDDVLAVDYRLVRAEPDDRELQRYPDHTVFQTQAWLEFVLATQGGEVVVADLYAAEQRIGRFTGVKVRRFGVSILGSPLPGWGSGYQGFALAPGASRTAAYRTLLRFAFEELGCLHVEVTDRLAPPEDLVKAGLIVDGGGWAGYEVDLRPSLEDIYGAMKPPARTAHRKSRRVGVTVERADGAHFAEDYHAQLRDVFAKQGLVPTYGIERVRALVRYMQPTGNLLLLRAIAPDGRCVATGIFPGANGVVHFWGGASWREHQHLRPNEAVHWAAIEHWKARGFERYDLMGGGQYKERYGAYPIMTAQGRASRFGLLEHLRNRRRAFHGLVQRASGKLLR